MIVKTSSLVPHQPQWGQNPTWIMCLVAHFLSPYLRACSLWMPHRPVRQVQPKLSASSDVTFLPFWYATTIIMCQMGMTSVSANQPGCAKTGKGLKILSLNFLRLIPCTPEIHLGCIQIFHYVAGYALARLQNDIQVLGAWHQIEAAQILKIQLICTEVNHLLPVLDIMVIPDKCQVSLLGYYLGWALVLVTPFANRHQLFQVICLRSEARSVFVR